MTERGTFIIICGIDGTGKTTQEELLADALLANGRRVRITKSPTDWYRQNPLVRNYLNDGVLGCSVETLALLSATDRMLQGDTEIGPALAAGSDVICNRYVYSTYAYFKARGADMAFVEVLNARVLKPDKGVLLTIDPSVSISRIRERDGDRAKFEERDAAYLASVQEEMLRRWPKEFVTINAQEDRSKIAEVIKTYVL